MWVKSDDFRANVFEHNVHVPSSPYINCSCCYQSIKEKKYCTKLNKNRTNLYRRRRRNKEKRTNLPQHFGEIFQFRRPAGKSSAVFKNRRF